MGDNYPVGAANDPAAPYNRKFKKVSVDISVTLSTSKVIEIPEEADEYNTIVLEKAVMEQIMLPQDYLRDNYEEGWFVDDFFVI